MRLKLRFIGIVFECIFFVVLFPILIFTVDLFTLSEYRERLISQLDELMDEMDGLEKD